MFSSLAYIQLRYTEITAFYHLLFKNIWSNVMMFSNFNIFLITCTTLYEKYTFQNVHNFVVCQKNKVKPWACSQGGRGSFIGLNPPCNGHICFLIRFVLYFVDCLVKSLRKLENIFQIFPPPKLLIICVYDFKECASKAPYIFF